MKVQAIKRLRYSRYFIEGELIEKGLRIFYPRPGLLSKRVPREGDTIKSIFAPGKTKVGIKMWKVMRRTDVLGSYAAVFQTERWLGASQES
jgi:hypothetical protein